MMQASNLKHYASTEIKYHSLLPTAWKQRMKSINVISFAIILKSEMERNTELSKNTKWNIQTSIFKARNSPPNENYG